MPLEGMPLEGMSLEGMSLEGIGMLISAEASGTAVQMPNEGLLGAISLGER